MNRIYLLLSGMLVFFAACDSSNDFTPGTDYLPLQVGNYWNFESISTEPGIAAHTQHREVVDRVTINEREYFLLVNTTTSSVNTHRDSVYYRTDMNGFVYVYRKGDDTSEDNRIRLYSRDGDTWTFPVYNDDVARIVVSEQSLIIGKRELKDCKNYFYDIEQWADEESTVTLAPGIGFVKEYANAWGIGQVLTSARIDGQVVDF